MKKISLLTMVTVAGLFCSGCAMFHLNVYQPNGGYTTKVVTQWSSFGDYDVKGKTFSLYPANDSIALNDLDFNGFAALMERSLAYSGAVKAIEGQCPDMHVLLDYKTFSDSYIEETLHDDCPSVLSSNGYISPTYAYRASLGIITKRTVYNHYVNVCALGCNGTESPDTLWRVSAACLGTFEQLHEVMPFVAYSLRDEYGKSCREIKTDEVVDVDYMFRLYYKNFLSQSNVVESPVCENSNVEFSVREYVNGNLVDEEHSHQDKAKLIYRISEFSEDDQKVIKAAAIADDEDNDIFRLATRLKIGFTPVGADMNSDILRHSPHYFIIGVVFG